MSIFIAWLGVIMFFLWIAVLVSQHRKLPNLDKVKISMINLAIGFIGGMSAVFLAGFYGFGPLALNVH